jgi:hypothetical protein
MAIGVGNPRELGIQRDSSTLRARIGHRFETDRFGIIPWVEFFHTHRDFFAATLLAGESSFFIDDAALSLGVGIEF